MTEKRISELDLNKLTSKKEFYPSPAAWEDEVIYFMMVDRFSDGKEKGYKDNNGKIVNDGNTLMYKNEDAGNATRTAAERQQWFEAGNTFVGGTLKGIQSKIGYLKRLGVTSLWISPIFKQIGKFNTYHGYGIQNFLDVDPHFGTREDLKDLTKTAHEHGIRVIMDIILNHSGDVFEYEGNPEPPWDSGKVYPVKGFRDQKGHPSIPFAAGQEAAWPEGAVWPIEFQEKATFSRMGRIKNWDFDPEFRQGDFITLKNLFLGKGSVEHYQASRALWLLCEVYKFWIAFADIDGFRVDTVKHVDDGANRIFASVIHEFTQAIGKENFYLIGEITGGRINAFKTLEKTGLNAALGIDDIPDKLEYLVKGYRNPKEYFDLFRNSLLVQKDSHVWFRNKVVTTFDDHDQVRKSYKARFCHDEARGQENFRVLLNALAFMTTTMGIPCIYYGTEQFFNGHGNNDRYLREAMFGGKFGAFESKERHFFNEESEVYRELAKILAIRKDKMALRRGRQFLRPISGNGTDFGLPHMIGGQIRFVIPWSRIFNDQEILLAINTDRWNTKEAWVTIDNSLHNTGDRLQCLYSTDKKQINQKVTVEARNGKSVLLSVPPAGFVIFE
jgi:glycosidase